MKDEWFECGMASAEYFKYFKYFMNFKYFRQLLWL